MNHDATEYFISKHFENVDADSAMIFLTFLCWRTVVLEGKTEGYETYRKLTRKLKKETNHIRKEDKIKGKLTIFPVFVVRSADKVLKLR